VPHSQKHHLGYSADNSKFTIYTGIIIHRTLVTNWN